MNIQISFEIGYMYATPGANVSKKITNTIFELAVELMAIRKISNTPLPSRVFISVVFSNTTVRDSYTSFF